MHGMHEFEKGTINSPIFVNERFWNVDTAFALFPASCDALLAHKSQTANTSSRP
jgi:hypothetical protein